LRSKEYKNVEIKWGKPCSGGTKEEKVNVEGQDTLVQLDTNEKE